jgi:phenylacetic acid degradation operon negative regulatory protein
MPAKVSNLDAWNRRLLRKEPPRSKSLIITIFGDSLLPYVPGVWLSELIRLLEPFGVNGQLARTSCFRLAEEGWLQSRREGRTSRYALTSSGRQRVMHAYHRVYDRPAREWNGGWYIVIPGPGPEAGASQSRLELRRELEWEGFGRLAGKLFIHPRPNVAVLEEVLERLGLRDEVVILRAETLDGFAADAVHSLTADSWNLDLVADHYSAFLQRFLPVTKLLEEEPSPEAAFVLQALLIHAFRRVVLHDPRLPAALLPATWPGYAAYDLCRTIYRRTFTPTLAHLSERLQEAKSRPLAANADFYERLGGLLPEA